MLTLLPLLKYISGITRMFYCTSNSEKNSYKMREAESESWREGNISNRCHLSALPKSWPVRTAHLTFVEQFIYIYTGHLERMGVSNPQSLENKGRKTGYMFFSEELNLDLKKVKSISKDMKNFLLPIIWPTGETFYCKDFRTDNACITTTKGMSKEKKQQKSKTFIFFCWCNA